MRSLIVSLVRRAASVVAFASRRAEEVRLTQVAGSLTFTTVLALVPLLAVALSVFSALPLFGVFRHALEGILTGSLLPQQMSSTILHYLNDFAFKAARLTAYGLVIVLATALIMVLTVDRVLNDIWRVRTRRPLARRLLIYSALITVGPLLLGASLTLTSFLASISVGLVARLPPATQDLLNLLPLVIGGAAFAALYVLVPNRRVRWADALAGGFVASALGELIKHGFAIYVARASYTSIYGAFAAVPLFLLWIYLSWLVTLFGAAIAASLPVLLRTRFADESLAGNDFVTAVSIVRELALARGRDGGRAGVHQEQVAAAVRAFPEDVEALMRELEQLGYVARFDRAPPGTWVLGCDPAATSLVPLFERLAVDSRLSLLSAGTPLAQWAQRGMAADWISQPLAALFGLDPTSSLSPAAALAGAGDAAPASAATAAMRPA